MAMAQDMQAVIWDMAMGKEPPEGHADSDFGHGHEQRASLRTQTVALDMNMRTTPPLGHAHKICGL